MRIPTPLNPMGLNQKDIYLTFRATEPGSNIKLTSVGSVGTQKIYYSKNNGDWILYTLNQVIDLNPRG